MWQGSLTRERLNKIVCLLFSVSECLRARRNGRNYSSLDTLFYVRKLRTRELSGLLKYLQLASDGAANGPEFQSSILFIKLSPITKSLHKAIIFVLSRPSLRRALILIMPEAVKNEDIS